MTITKKEINHIPASVLGNPSRNVYLYIHGQGGNKKEAYCGAEIFCRYGYQVLSIDLAEHGGRKGETYSFAPWHIIPELTEVMKFAKERWEKISLEAAHIKNDGLSRCFPGTVTTRTGHSNYVWSDIIVEVLGICAIPSDYKVDSSY